MSSNCLVFHTSGGISSSPAAFLFLIFLRTESSSSCVNGPSLMSNCLLIILVIGSCVIFGGFPSKFSKCCFYSFILSCWFAALSFALAVFFLLLTSFIVCQAILDCLSSTESLILSIWFWMYSVCSFMYMPANWYCAVFSFKAFVFVGFYIYIYIYISLRVFTFNTYLCVNALPSHPAFISVYIYEFYSIFPMKSRLASTLTSWQFCNLLQAFWTVFLSKFINAAVIPAFSSFSVLHRVLLISHSNAPLTYWFKGLQSVESCGYTLEVMDLQKFSDSQEWVLLLVWHGKESVSSM